MVRRGDDVVVLWPRYFDARLTRAQGRRVPTEQAVKDPDAKWLEAAAKKAGLDARLEEGARDPFKPWKSVGRIVVTGKGGKGEKIRLVAKHMQKE